jgi:short-subunit dehydrogenase
MQRSHAFALAGGAAALAALSLARRRRRRFDFAGRVALVTGGSRGLGLVLARELAARGARLVLCARDAEELARAAHELRERGADVLDVACDVSRPDEIASLLSSVRARYGSVDVLVNNAGVIRVGPAALQREADFEEALRIHFWGALRLMLALLPEMCARHEGRIVNIASIGGKVAVPHMAAYSASKFALVGLSESVRSEVAREGVFVTTVCPGMMRTGSHLNARFLQREEYGWFSTANALPLVSISAERAAHAILAATAQGRAVLVLPFPARLATWVNALAPELTARFASGVNRLLPDTNAEPDADWRGLEARGDAAAHPTASDRAAARNNELAPGEA